MASKRMPRKEPTLDSLVGTLECLGLGRTRLGSPVVWFEFCGRNRYGPVRSRVCCSPMLREDTQFRIGDLIRMLCNELQFKQPGQMNGGR